MDGGHFFGTGHSEAPAFTIDAPHAVVLEFYAVFPLLYPAPALALQTGWVGPARKALRPELGIVFSKLFPTIRAMSGRLTRSAHDRLFCDETIRWRSGAGLPPSHPHAAYSAFGEPILESALVGHLGHLLEEHNSSPTFVPTNSDEPNAARRNTQHSCNHFRCYILAPTSRQRVEWYLSYICHFSQPHISTILPWRVPYI